MPPVLAVMFIIAIAIALQQDADTAGDPRAPSFYALAEAIAAAEGFGVAGAIPTVRNNPGDLKLDGQTITTFPTAAAGWDALYHQLDLIRDGGSRFYTPSTTLGAFASRWTATEQSAWLGNVVRGLQGAGVPATSSTTLGELL